MNSFSRKESIRTPETHAKRTINDSFIFGLKYDIKEGYFDDLYDVLKVVIGVGSVANASLTKEKIRSILSNMLSS